MADKVKSENSDYIIVICSQTYQSSIDIQPEEKVKGVYWEFKNIIKRLRNDTKNTDSRQPKFIIPVIYSEEDRKYIPDEIKDFSCYNMSNLKEKEKFYHHIWYGYETQITFIKNLVVDETLLDSSFKCYSELFPDREERDSYTNIRYWLQESYDLGFEGELYAVIHTGETAVGMGYVSCYEEQTWSFCSYLAVKPIWRQNDNAKKLVEELEKAIQVFDPNIQGIVFEVRRVDISLLEKAYKVYKQSENVVLSQIEDYQEIIHNLRSYRRVKIFQNTGLGFSKNKVFMVLLPDNSPFPFRQPALREPLNETQELDMFLMVYLFDKNSKEKISAKEIVNFIYEAYAEDYGCDSVAAIPNYEDYIHQDWYPRMSRFISDDMKVDKLAFPSFIQSFLEALERREGIKLGNLDL